MKNKLFVLILSLGLGISFPTFADSGLITVQSPHSVQETVEKLKQVLDEKGMTLFAHVKHSQSASEVGVTLRPTELLIFGNPKVGSILMECQQTTAIDLPQKALVMQNSDDEVWVLYNDPAYIADRHHIEGKVAKCDATIDKVSKALANIMKTVTEPK
ncbi:DUF302 domain-containing protein [Photobacterium sp. BZF1]|uniref:DUF302 domain-containing protein n=1 Tax=Photobacterium sp. BZF1 TaxID=1904457 RepID=UPI001653D1E5|nr:DUF302 domain-containing protein [Photobacterium sp. BZF1]MBC7004219.1 DUF302 domain-containing protein [Photobacterium sp. BZF1]